MSAELHFQDYERLCRWVTAKVMRRAKARGLTIDQGDAFQEICLLWVQCRDRFDPEKGKFSTFFVRTVLLAFNQGNLVDRVNGRQPKGGMVSLNALCGDDDDDDGYELQDVIADRGLIDIEEAYAEREEVARRLDTNPVLKRLIQLTADTPPELMAHLEALRAQKEYSRSLEVPIVEAIPTAMTPELLRKLFQFNWRQRKLAQTELIDA